MPASDIVIKGAREHNLQDVNLVLPRNQLICLTGVSGSGKSSLAFDTLYAEGQRRYVESLSTFARQFLGQMPKPDVDFLSGLSPSISISQKSSGRNPRSTVGTITEIYDYLRVLYARVGLGHCPKCHQPITAQTRDQIVARIAALPAKTRYALLAPVIRQQKGEFRDLFRELLRQGFVRARVDGEVVNLTDDLSLDRQMRHNVEVVVDRLTAGSSNRARLAEAVETALKAGQGNLIVAVEAAEQTRPTELGGAPPATPQSTRKSARRAKSGMLAGDIAMSAAYSCNSCGIGFEPPSPQLFSFNSPQGMCLECDGLGEFYSFDPELVVTEPDKSFKNGCIELVGTWKDVGRWKRHIYQGVAETLARVEGEDVPDLLETPWRELPERFQDALLWGTGEQHITFTWRVGSSTQKYGGTYEGIIPEFVDKYRSSKSRPQIRRLEKFMRVIGCPDCQGDRINPQAKSVLITTASERFAERPARSLPEVSALPVSEAIEFFKELKFDATQTKIASEALKEIRGRLGFLINVGLDYLTLDRTAPTLSGGETQRIRLAGQIGCGLVGVLYILDEPSIGLHPRDNDRLLASLQDLRDQGNTVLVVEHDEDTMRAADHIVDFGPGPGVHGGHVVAEGSVDVVEAASESVTGNYLSGRRKIHVPEQRRPVSEERRLIIRGATHNNLKNTDIELPLGAFICVTGVSGSGKSSAVNDILVEALRRDLNNGNGEPGAHTRIDGVELLDKMIAIDQSPIGRTPRSNPGTYIKVFDEIRSLFAKLPDSRRRGFKPGRFSFNVRGGRCEACEGNGSNRLEMDFLADVWVVCPVCNGARFNHETLQVRFRGKSIADVLDMDVQQALDHFANIPQVHDKLATLQAVGMDYVKIGQPSPTLSGGEAQRIKLARELVKKSTGQTLYLLDEPTTGLHFADIELLLKVLHGFVDAGNTVLVVEHNLDVIKTADWIVDMGPEGGHRGGEVVATGTPEQIIKARRSHTGRALKRHLAGKEAAKGAAGGKSRRQRKPYIATHIQVQGATQHNLRHVNVKIARDEMTVCCGPSGSGKSSLAMDTIYAEGQRRYVESLSAYARQFVGQMQKPAIEHIEGLSPAIAIEQRQTGHTPRSTVGTVTEIYDYFRILYSRMGQPFCPDCDIPVGTQTADDIIEKILAHEEGTRLLLMAPVEVEVGHQYDTLWEELRAAGYGRVRIDGHVHELDAVPTIDRRRKHDVEVVVDRIAVKPGGRSRIADSVENTLQLGRGVIHVARPLESVDPPKWPVNKHSLHRACEQCGRSFEALSPHHFSFNSAIGWCPSCEGLGTQTGANPAALIRDPQATLAEQALLLWPDLEQPLARTLLEALAAEAQIPTDVPYAQLSPRQRRIILYGFDNRWIQAVVPAADGSPECQLKFQFKGLYPALEEAARLSPSLRAKVEHLVDEIECSECGGSRLRDEASAVRARGLTLEQVSRMPIGALLTTLDGWKLDPRERKIAGELLREIKNRLTFLNEVGLEYLTIGRSAPTLSGGESQRIRLASQVGSGLCGVLYVLDEPTIGLHPRDNRRLVTALHKLRDLGNTLLVVEHDKEVVASADQLLDFGPAAGRLGGQIVAKGSPAEVAAHRRSVTGPYLSGRKAIAVPAERRLKSLADEPGDASTKETSLNLVGVPTPRLEILGARHHNLKDLDIAIPLHTLTAVAGVSGSGKSTLIHDILYAQLARTLHRARTVPGGHRALRGVEHINKVIRVDQQPLGNTPTSNPATYTGVFELIRQLFAQLPEAKLRGFTARRFSFNVAGGRCDECDGAGQKCIEMHFLPDVWVECESCRGKRYNPETLAVRYHGKSIADVLEMSCGDARQVFANIPKIRHILQTLCDVGLDYVTLGQSAPTLSGGEAQRVKLAAELARPDTGRTLYLLDEPTTGLHFDDLAKLLEVLHRLVDLGNTVVVIEHNLDVIKTADWVIELGPEAGIGGGQLVVQGTPEDVVAHARAFQEAAAKPAPRRKTKPAATKTPRRPPRLRSHTGEALDAVLEAGPRKKRRRYDFAAEMEEREGDLDLADVGQDAQMPWEVDGRRWHTVDRVGRDGSPCQWEGRVLEEIERRIQDLGDFAATQWNSRTVVEITSRRKTEGWFFHAVTGEKWLLKLKFRTAKNTFRRESLIADLALPTLDDLHDLPVYGNSPRVRCKNIRGPFQEIQIDVHKYHEIDTPAFWDFLERAVNGFATYSERVRERPEDVMPWKKLGQKWHLSRKGFPPGKPVRWKVEILEDLVEVLGEAAPDGQFLWNNQQVVHLMVPEQREPWASIYTKKWSGLDLALNGPKDEFALGRVAELGTAREVATEHEGRDTIKLRLDKAEQVNSEALAAFLQEHRSAVRAATAS